MRAKDREGKLMSDIDTWWKLVNDLKLRNETARGADMYVCM